MPDGRTVASMRFVLLCVLRALLAGYVVWNIPSLWMIANSMYSVFGAARPAGVKPNVSGYVAQLGPLITIVAGYLLFERRLLEWLVPAARVACPGCGYDVGSPIKGRCPECGLRLGTGSAPATPPRAPSTRAPGTDAPGPG
ncbi:MAG: hypothetical protein JNM07_09325 [Phycisphaerae bacterium]|nr:hypothetical protein [Phycisphaerae bacterium]